MKLQSGGKLVIAVLVITAAVVGYVKFSEFASLEYLASQETRLRDYQQQHPAITYLLAFLVYVTVTGLSIPGATAVTLICGWFFGFARGSVLVSFASTAGATVAFLLSRYLLHSTVQNQFGKRLDQFNESLRSEGPFYLFTMRLIPVIPFFVINAVMGLTPMKTSTFWWVSQLGMLPATLVYVYAGSSVPSLTELAEQGTSGVLTPQLFVAFALLGMFPFAARYVLSKFRSQASKGEMNV